MTRNDQIWMRAALGLAREAAPFGEVPVGAVVVYDGRVVGRAHNLRETASDPPAHAEKARALDTTRKSLASTQRIADAAVAKARAFVTACQLLIRRTARRSRHGPAEVEVDVEAGCGSRRSGRRDVGCHYPPGAPDRRGRRGLASNRRRLPR